MKTVELVSASRQYVTSKIHSPEDLSGLDIAIAFFQEAPPTEDQWHPAEWDLDDSTRARILVGPGTAVGQLAPGWWTMRIRLVSYPEFPHLDCGIFTVIP